MMLKDNISEEDIGKWFRTRDGKCVKVMHIYANHSVHGHGGLDDKFTVQVLRQLPKGKCVDHYTPDGRFLRSPSDRDLIYRFDDLEVELLDLEECMAELPFT